MRTILIIAVLFMSNAVLADDDYSLNNPYNYGGAKDTKPSYGTSTDLRSGNTYNWNRDSLGNTNVRGYNYNSGASWNSTYNKNGDSSGYDSQGNYWTYNNSAKTYNNYGTSKTCVGTGAAKTCY